MTPSSLLPSLDGPVPVFCPTSFTPRPNPFSLHPTPAHLSAFESGSLFLPAACAPAEVNREQSDFLCLTSMAHNRQKQQLQTQYCLGPTALGWNMPGTDKTYRDYSFRTLLSMCKGDVSKANTWAKFGQFFTSIVSGTSLMPERLLPLKLQGPAQILGFLSKGKCSCGEAGLFQGRRKSRG